MSIPIHEAKMTKLSALKPADYNPRSIDKDAARRLRSSLESFGLVENLIANKKTGLLVGGHQRFSIILDAFGGDLEAEVPVVWLTLSDEEEAALNIGLNGEYGKYDPNKLKTLLQSLETKKPELLKSTGLSGKTIGSMLGGRSAGLLRAKTQRVVSDAVQPVFRPEGKLEIGLQNILCSDARNPSPFVREATIAFIDLPLKTGTYEEEDSLRSKYKGSDRLQDEDWQDTCDGIISSSVSALARDGVFFCLSRQNDLDNIVLMLRKHGLEKHSLIVWDRGQVRNGPVDYRPQYDFIIFGWQKGKARRAGASRSESDLWRIDNDLRTNVLHPYQRPAGLYEKVIRNHTEPGELIVDFSCGSGTALVAAQKLGRKGFGMDIEPFYCDIAHARVTALMEE